jgi:hypothetical protein
VAIAYGPKNILRAVAAGADRTSDDVVDSLSLGRPCEVALYFSASVQVVWAALTGTINGILSIECSDDGVNWKPKLNPTVAAAITVSGASGQDTISFDQNVTERYYRAKWTKTGVTGGTITCLFTAKG